MALTSEEIAAKVREIIRAQDAGDKAAWLGSFAADAVDEVGTNRHEGREAIGANWDALANLGLRLWCEEPVIVTGNEAIAVVRCRVGNRHQEVRIVDVYTFDADGKIALRRHRSAPIQ
jgi:hypothetical protein